MVVSVVAGKQMNEVMMTLIRNIMVAGVKSLNAEGRLRDTDIGQRKLL